MAGIKKGQPSRRGRVGETVRDMVTVSGFAVNHEEVGAEYQRRFPGEDVDIGNVLASLASSGVLVPVFGRPPNVRYTHRDLPGASVPPTEPMLAAVEIIDAHWEKTAREMPTRDLTNAMRARGVVLPHPNNYRFVLDALTQPATRGAPAWRSPQLECRHIASRHGAERIMWRPAGTPTPETRVPADQVEAARDAVARAEGALRRPVTRGETVLWIAAHHESDDVARFLYERRCFGAALAQLSERRVARRVRGHGDWSCVKTEYTVPGLCPERYTAGVALWKDYGPALEVEDRCMTYRPAAEMESLNALSALTSRLHASALQDIHALRRSLLASTVRETDSYGPLENELLSEVTWILSAAHHTLIRWTEKLPVNARSGRRAPFVSMLGHLEVLPRIKVPAGLEPEALVLAEHAIATHNDLRPYVEAVPAAVDREYASDESLRMFYDTARRVPNPSAEWVNKGKGQSLVPKGREGLGWMLVDRVDALLAIWSTVSPPRATALLSAASTILGHILRDPGPLLLALGRTPSARGDVRRPLMIALALLGVATPLDMAAPDPADAQDAAAYILSRVLCCTDQNALTSDVAAVLRRATTVEARTVATEAIRMISAGRLLTVVG